MAKFRFHKFLAFVVLVGVGAWVATGEFTSVGSAQTESAAPAAAEAAPPAETKALVRTVAVVIPPRVQHARAIRISGLTGADKRATIAARAGGIIAELKVEQGQPVKAGDLMLKLDAEEKTAAVETATQLVAQREAEWTAAQRLIKTGSLPKLQADTFRSALAAARSQLEAAESELSRNEVRAPFDGIVDRVAVELGSSVMAGAEIATVLALDPIVGKGEISERDLRYLKIGDTADVRLVNGEVVKGKVRYISRDASAQTRTFQVEVAIPNPDLKIPAGMTAEIVLRAAPADAVILPRSVVTLSDAGDLGIRAVDQESKVTFFPIDLVDDSPTGLVLGGIPAEARVIVAGQELVTEGDVVKAVEADQELVKKLVSEASGGTQ